MRVLLKDRGRCVDGHWAFDGSFDGLGLPLVGHGAYDCGGFHNLTNRHADGLGGDVVERGKPTFAHLLTATGLVEIDHEVGFVGLEVGGGIVEGEMAIFADTYAGDVDRVVADDFSQPLAFGDRVFVISVDPVKFFWTFDLIAKSFFEVASKTGRVGFGQADIFIQVEASDALPVEIELYQLAEQFKLACSGGENDIGLASGVESFLDKSSGAGSRDAAHRGFLGFNMDLQSFVPFK